MNISHAFMFNIPMNPGLKLMAPQSSFIDNYLCLNRLTMPVIKDLRSMTLFKWYRLKVDDAIKMIIPNRYLIRLSLTREKPKAVRIIRFTRKNKRQN